MEMRIFLATTNLVLALALLMPVTLQTAQAGSRGKGMYNSGQHYSAGKRGTRKRHYWYKPRKRVEYVFKKETVKGREVYVVRPAITRRGDPNDKYRQNTSRKLIQTTRPKYLGSK
jgi:hypothetical protein